MYRYKIGFTSYEESNFVELENVNKFTYEELRDIVARATVEVVKQLKSLPLEKQNYVYTHNFEDIFRSHYCRDIEEISLSSILISKFGFKRIEYEQTFSVFGWPSIFHKGDWRGQRDEDLEYITNSVNAAGFTKKDDSHLRDEPEENIG